MLPSDWIDFLVRERMAERHREAERARLVRQTGPRHTAASRIAEAARLVGSTVSGLRSGLRRPGSEPRGRSEGAGQQATRHPRVSRSPGGSSGTGPFVRTGEEDRC